jgi:hypothetical protein
VTYSSRSDSSTHLDARRRTVTRTFRIRQEWDDVLQEEAETQGISVNVLVNQILRRYALFIRQTDKGGALSVSQTMLQAILNELSDEHLATAGATSGPSDVLNTLSMMGRPTTYNAFTYLLSEHLGGNDFSRWFTCFHHAQSGKDLFHLQHTLGRGWSIYLANYLRSSLTSLLNVEVETKVYDFAVNLTISPPPAKH